MIYGLYLSATGVMTSSYKQDVIANNLANADTAGFKRDVAGFRERLTEAQEGRRLNGWSDPVLEGLGGGMFANPTRADLAQGMLEESGSPLDVAIEGNGFFAAKDGDQTRLTRDGRFSVSRDGRLVLPGGQQVLDVNGHTIPIAPEGAIEIDDDGNITQAGAPVARLAFQDVPDRAALQKVGNDLFAYPDGTQIKAADGKIRGKFIERSNVDPTTEMAELMDTQRQLEANANMIRTQDSLLQRLVNDVGKIS